MSNKNILFTFIVTLVMVMIVEALVAQRPLRGRIVYKITYPGSMIDLAELQELPDRAVITTKNNMARTELTRENAGLSQIKVSNGQTRETATMIEILREKYVIERNATEIQNALRNMPQPEFEYTDEVVEILGFQCRKVIARITDDFGIEHESEIFYTTEIPGTVFNFDTPYHSIPGLMLKYEMRVGPLNIRYEAQSVRRRLFVGSRNFYVTRDYTPITFDELRNLLQGDF